MRYYLGIDGGGSKTTAVLCDETGREISRYLGKELNYNAVGMETARAHLRETVEGVLAGEDLRPDAVCIGLSALSDRADAALTRAFCGGVVPCDTVILDSDVFIALEAMAHAGPVAVAVAGTGSMAAGRTPDGAVIHTGGWGHLLGDEGSGYALALAAVRAVLACAEGRGEPTALTDAVFAFFGAANAESLLERFYDPYFSRSAVAALAPAVFETAAAGDAVAAAVIKRQASSFAATVMALLRRLPAGTPLGLWGGLFERQPDYAAIFAEEIHKEFPQTKTALLPIPPVFGAVRAVMRAEKGDAQ